MEKGSNRQDEGQAGWRIATDGEGAASEWLIQERMFRRR